MLLCFTAAFSQPAVVLSFKDILISVKVEPYEDCASMPIFFEYFIVYLLGIDSTYKPCYIINALDCMEVEQLLYTIRC